MANVTTCSTHPLECKSLIEFKEFLQNYQIEVQGSGDGSSTNGGVLRTRNNTDFYSVTMDELEAEVMSCLWLLLQTRKCPLAFCFGILRTLSKDIMQSLKNSKEFGDVIVNVSANDNEDMGKQFHLLKLQKFVGEKLENLLIKLCDNSNIESLVSYALNGMICQDNKSQCDCGEESSKSKDMVLWPFAKVAFLKNKPRKMEDRHVVLEDFGEIYNLTESDNYNSYQFYAVFDGHSGSLAAIFASAQLPYLLAKQLKERVIDNHNDEAYREAFETAFLQVDNKFSLKNLSSGTTAVCALLRHDKQNKRMHLYIAWVGDSKALLVSPKVSLQLVKPHKPDSPEERKRIESSETGGTVLFVQGQWRVNGILNVARTIGDISLGNSVIAEPDFVDICLPQNSHDFLILATDGLWDHVSESKIVDTVYNMLQDDQKTLEDIPKTLIDLAKQGDSQDNITIIIVFLKERSKFLTKTPNLP